MSKSTTDRGEFAAFLDRPSSAHLERPSDGQQLQVMSVPPASEDVEAFAKANRLMHKLDVFQKASLLISGESLHKIPDISNLEIQAIQQETERKWRQPKLLYFTILVCSVGAIEQGWAQTSMNGANLYFPQAFGIGSDSPRDNLIVGFINSGIYLSAGVM
jgi:hypothetical protein